MPSISRSSRFTRAWLSCVVLLASACTIVEAPANESSDEPVVLAAQSQAASVPAQFSDVQLTTQLGTPTAMEVAPDGRIFVCDKGGALRVVKNGSLLSTPFLQLNVDGAGERGLLGVAFDPSFASEKWVYVYYSVAGAAHNRVSRFKVSAGNADVSDGVENVLLELSPLSSAVIHNGGAIHFGADGKLYIATGENSTPRNAQSLTTQLGKLLRINKDGSIPGDNPFFNASDRVQSSIWAYGFRNPYTFAVQPGTGRIFVNDVGQDSWEEVDELVKGANYGWPDSEGMTTIAGHQNPFFVYKNGEGVNQEDCSIIGAAFYNPAAQQFPSDYLGAYFFGDFCSGYIKRLDPATRAVTTFATGITQLIDIKIGTEGALYYVTLGGALSRVSFTGSLAPVIGVQPTSRTVSVGQSTTFSVSASGSAPLNYQWQLNGSNIAGATGPSYTRSNVQTGDNGGQFRVLVSNNVGSVTSNAAVLTVTSNQPPVANITSPAASATYVAGTSIAFSGHASDPEDGALPASAFTWKVDFHHDAHSHPVLAATSGSTSGSFTASDRGETASNVWYRVTLTVTDSGGLTHTVVRDIQPIKALITLSTVPSGLRVKLDGTAVTTPYNFTGVAGVIRTIEAISPQLSPSGERYVHVSWSDAKAALHEIVTPATATTFTDTLRAESAWSSLDVGSVGLAGSFAQNGASYELRGSGDDIWNGADAFRFGYQALVGDGRITARVVSLSNTNDWAKAGVMVRESTAAGSRHALMAVTTVNGLAFQRRDATGGSSFHTGVGGSAPQWVRLVRTGNNLKGFRSSDGVTWTQVGETNQTLPSQVLIGLAITSHNNTALSVASFDSVSIEPAGVPFMASDIGSVGLSGSTAANAGTYTVKGAGADIYNQADGFQFYHRALSGDGEIRVRVASITNTDQWAKAGVMIRESTAPGAKHAYVGVTPTNGREFLRREQSDGATTPQGTTGGAPSWLRLVRQGNLFTSYLSSDGVNWTPFGSATIVMGANVRVGLAVTSHNTSVLCTGVFDSLSVVD